MTFLVSEARNKSAYCNSRCRIHGFAFHREPSDPFAIRCRHRRDAFGVPILGRGRKRVQKCPISQFSGRKRPANCFTAPNRPPRNCLKCTQLLPHKASCLTGCSDGSGYLGLGHLERGQACISTIKFHLRFYGSMSLDWAFFIVPVSPTKTSWRNMPPRIKRSVGPPNELRLV